MNFRTRFNQVRASLILAVMVAMPMLSARPADAETYYVSTSGSNSNPGSQQAPWGSINYAVSRLFAGDTLYIRGGTYTSPADAIDSQAVSINSGTSWGNPITVAGYPGETVTMRPPDGYPGIRLTQGAPHYLVFQDLAIDMSQQTDPGNPIVWSMVEAIYVASGAHHIRFQRLDIGHCMNNCIQFSTHDSPVPFVANNELLNSTVHHAGQATGDWEYSHGGPGINTGYGIYSVTDGNLLDGNEFYSNNAYAVNVYGSDNVIRNNRIHDNGLRGGSNWGINIGSDSYPGRSANNFVYNNVVYNNRWGGIKIYTNADNTLVYNNTVYANGLYGVMGQYYGVNNVVRNNIIYSNGTSNFFDAGGSGPLQADHNLMSDPGFTDAASANFVLKPGSAAIDSGVNVDTITTDVAGLPRPQGLGFDIGANELGTANAALTAPTNLRVMR